MKRTINIKSSEYLRAPSPPTNLPFKIRSAGRTIGCPYHSTLGTYNDDAMLTLVVDGSGWYRDSLGGIPVKAGMLGLVLPCKDTGILMSDPDDPYEHFYCRFAGHEGMKTASRIKGRMGGTAFVHFESWHLLAEAFRQLLSASTCSGERDGSVEKMSPADALLAYLLALIDNPPERRDGRLSRDKLDKYMTERISNPVDLNEMAAAFGVTKEHLCRSAKKLLAVTLHRHWLVMKMEWARKLLQQESISVAEAGRRVGYRDPFYFSKAFKSFHGVSPLDWRRAN